MSSPPESITDIDEIALNKKRGRAQSVEPAPLQELDSEHHASEDTSSTTVSAPKKTKRDDEDSSNNHNNTTTVNTIRKNMKDMTTTDKALTESASTATSISQEDEQIDDEPMAEQENSLANKFGGGKSKQNGGDDDDDWGEFAQDDDEEEEDTKKDNTATATTKVEDKPKYTFGASSGFGTKGWAATHQTIPAPSKQPTFGGFGSSTSSASSGGSGGFGGFKSSILSENKSSTSVPSFGSFAKATASPFATAAAAGNAFTSSTPPTTTTIAAAAAAPQTNTLHSTPSSTNTTTTTAAVEFVRPPNNNNHANESNENSSESDQEHPTSTTPATFGEGAKVKVPGVVQQTQVTTGEEDEDTIYQTKAKLLILDTASGNWKERGVGTFRINMKEEETKKVLQTRLVMRTDSVYRVILNLLLFQGMKVFIMQDKFVRFAGFETEIKEDGTSETKLVSFALKLSNPSLAKEVCEQIISCIPHSSSSAGDNDDSKA